MNMQGYVAVNRALANLKLLKSFGRDAFNIKYSFTRKTAKEETVTYNSYDDAVNGVKEKVESVGGAVKIANIIVKAIIQPNQEDKSQYNCVTLRELVDYVNNHKKDFPYGLDTPVMFSNSQDDHEHETASIKPLVVDDDGFSKALLLTYDMSQSIMNMNELDKLVEKVKETSPNLQ